MVQQGIADGGFIMTGFSGEALAQRLAATDEIDDQYREAFLEAGGEIHEASDELIAALAEAWSPIYQSWIDAADATGIDGAAALAYYREQVALIAAGN